MRSLTREQIETALPIGREVRTLAGDDSLDDSREWLGDRLAKGTRCPCCGKHAQVYRRKLNRTMVAVLRALHDAGGSTWFVHAADACRATGVKQQGEASKLALFGLVAANPLKRDDGGHRGEWRLTTEGYLFLAGEHCPPKHAIEYDGRRIGWDGPPTGIAEVAPAFRLDELRAGL